MSNPWDILKTATVPKERERVFYRWNGTCFISEKDQYYVVDSEHHPYEIWRRSPRKDEYRYLKSRTLLVERHDGYIDVLIEGDRQPGLLHAFRGICRQLHKWSIQQHG